MNLLEDAISIDILAGIGGIQATKAVRCLIDNKEVSEKDLAQKLHISEQSVRSILHKLYNENIVTFRKVRFDKAWYIYYWSLQKERFFNLMMERRSKIMCLLQKKLDYESRNEFFSCDKCFNRLTFEFAFDKDFICPLCGEPLNQYDNSFKIEELNAYISQLDNMSLRSEMLCK